jgi:uncharacterized protein
MKYVIWVAIIFAGLWWIRQQRSGANAPSKKNKGSNVMLPCAHCGLHIPESEAVLGPPKSNGAQMPYCSQQHLQQHQGRA